MKNVLLLVHDDDGQEARLQAALDLTRALQGHLHCLDVAALPIVAEPIWSAAAATIAIDEATREVANVARLQDRLSVEDVAWSMVAMRGDFGAALQQAARTADVVVLNRKLERFANPDMLKLVARLLDSDVLILAVDQDCRAYDPTAPVLVAWDGSEPAMHALQQAVPLLRLARSVTIFQAGPSEPEAMPAEEAARYLARHDLKPEVKVTLHRHHVPQQIVEEAAEIEAGACVMGGYGHGRLREAIFGGVTRELLGSGGLPLLIGR